MLDYRGAGGWVRLSIDDTGGRGAVQSVQVRTSGTTSWQSLQNTWGAEWETSSAPPPPLDFRITTGEPLVSFHLMQGAGQAAISAHMPGAAGFACVARNLHAFDTPRLTAIDNGEAVVAASVIKTSSAISTSGAPAVQ